MTDAPQQQALADWLVSDQGGYLAARVLPDGSVAALQQLMYTRAILLGVNRESYESRFCFKDFALAQQRFEALLTEDDEPQGYVARRDWRATA